MKRGIYNKIKIVYGVGINDADYVVQMRIREKGEPGKVNWVCPYYARWCSMIQRTCSEDFKAKNPSYVDCALHEDWIYFSNFKAWMEQQDWEGKQLDKDLLVPGNKIYGPDTCVFVDRQVNNFIYESAMKYREECPIGVCYHKDRKKYQATCGSADNVYTYLGLYETPEEAHKVWLDFKLQQAYILAQRQKDPRVAAALIDRYENYHKYFPVKGF